MPTPRDIGRDWMPAEDVRAWLAVVLQVRAASGRRCYPKLWDFLRLAGIPDNPANNEIRKALFTWINGCGYVAYKCGEHVLAQVCTSSAPTLKRRLYRLARERARQVSFTPAYLDPLDDRL